jgi:UDP-glucose 4-epimerase
MKILVTGSSGTVGTRLCERLLSDGHSVVGVDRVRNKWQSNVQSVTKQLDLLFTENVAELPTDIDAIVHLAANARVYELVEHPEMAKENMETTFHMLEFARKNGIKKFLFSSSREVYGNAGRDRYSEDMVKVTLSESPYAAGKLGDEAMVQSYTRCYGVDHIIWRFSNVYGMYDDSERVVPLFIRLAKAGKPLTVFGKEKCLDFTYIDDTVEGIVQSLLQFDRAKNETYNLAFGEGNTIFKLAEMIKELTGSSSDISVGTPRTGEVVRYTADITKARKALGYDPKVRFEDGVRKAVEWYAAH